MGASPMSRRISPEAKSATGVARLIGSDDSGRMIIMMLFARLPRFAVLLIIGAILLAACLADRESFLPTIRQTL